MAPEPLSVEAAEGDEILLTRLIGHAVPISVSSPLQPYYSVVSETDGQVHRHMVHGMRFTTFLLPDPVPTMPKQAAFKFFGSDGNFFAQSWSHVALDDLLTRSDARSTPL